VESGGLKGVTLNNTMINGLCKIEMVDEVMNLRKKCIPKI
jgi:pentatricopeptide repeat protein